MWGKGSYKGHLMRKNYCDRCRRKPECVKPCNKVESTVSGKNGRKARPQIDVVNESDLAPVAHARYMNCVWGELEEE